MSEKLIEAFKIFLDELGARSQSGSPISEAIKNLQMELQREKRKSKSKKDTDDDDDKNGVGFAVV